MSIGRKMSEEYAMLIFPILKGEGERGVIRRRHSPKQLCKITQTDVVQHKLVRPQLPRVWIPTFKLLAAN